MPRGEEMFETVDGVEKWEWVGFWMVIWVEDEGNDHRDG
jgi:hypothetical protein